MASKSENRRVNLYINGKEVKNDIKSIRNEYIKSLSQLNRMTRGSKEYYDQVKKIKKLKGVLDQHNKTLGRTRKAWAGFKTQMGAWIATGFGLAAAGQIFKSFINNIKNFEKATSGLSALTGLMGDELDWLKKKALGMNIELRESGIRMKQTATDVLEAYKIVGSAKPELLKNKEALAETTKQAIILSEAAGMTLVNAVKSLTGNLNQFDESADQSERFINVMAAGAQAGAGDIQYLSEAIEKAGTTMNLMGISYEKGVALIETAAPRFTKAAMAGNSLDKVLLKMKEKGIGYTDGVFDMNTALLELKTRYEKGETSAKIFGVEHSKMAEILVQNIDDFKKYTEAVTGTNTAVEMAATNTDNFAGRLDSLKTNWSNFMIGLNEGQGWLSKAFSAILDMADEAIMEWRRWTMSAEEKAYEKKLKAQQDFIKKFKEHNKLGQEDIEAEWKKYLDIHLTGYKDHLDDLDAEDKKRYDEQLKNIQDHLELIRQAKEQIAAEIAAKKAAEPPPPPSGDGDEELDEIETSGELTEADELHLEKMQMLADAELDIVEEKLNEIEQRESDSASAIHDGWKLNTEQRIAMLNALGNASISLGNSLLNFNRAAMNKELKAAGDNYAKRDEIRKKYAKKGQIIDIAQARIAGALAIMNIWKGDITGNAMIDTILKAILTAAQIIRTESQVSVIKSQSFAAGGFTNGAKHYIAGEAGTEYIAPNWQVEHPVYGPVIEDLNNARMGIPSQTTTTNISNYNTDSLPPTWSWTATMPTSP